MTDGHCTAQYEAGLARNAAALRNLRENTIWSIGVRGVDGADLKELTTITANPNQVLMIDDFQMIEAIKQVWQQWYVLYEKVFKQVGV